MTKRGKVLRVPGEAPGLLMVEGRQFRFALDDLWTSAVPPVPGLVVEVKVDSKSQLTAIFVPADAQSQCKREALSSRRHKAIQNIANVIGRIGVMNIAVALVLVVAWRFLTNVSLQLPLVGRLDFTFWQVLGLIHEKHIVPIVHLRHGLYSVGYYGWLAAAALVGPFLTHIWKDRLALFGGVVPLVFTIIIWMLARTMLQNALSASIGETYADLGRNLRLGFLSVASFKIGAYLSIIAGVYFTFAAARQCFARRMRDAKDSLECSKSRVTPLS